jgi:molecular chaperone HtpG
MEQLLERFDLQTNFQGLIQLLAKHLYPEPDVFVRELIQNAHDSIVRRKDVEPELQGQIDVSLDHDARTITFRDNGIGMDRSDIKEFLSVIGSTGTGTIRRDWEDERHPAPYELIGQFGVGLLSAFVVADHVTVTTRKLGDASAFIWHNAGSARCELYAAHRKQVGTEIILTVGVDYTFMLDEKRLTDAIVKYCDFIPFPIGLNGVIPVNEVEAPWHQATWDSPSKKDEAYREAVTRRFSDSPLEVIPVEIDERFQARGVLYISNHHLPDLNISGTVDLFVRRMFIRGDDPSVLPSWAKFVRGVIDSPDLQPTAARDNIQREHESFSYLQRRLGELVIERLARLAEYHPEKFRQINLWHHFHLKGMACQNDDFFKKAVDLLLFDTNKGLMSLNEYRAKAPLPETENATPIYYVGAEGGTTVFYRMANARDMVVIKAGPMFDLEVLRGYATHNSDSVRLVRIDAEDDERFFERLSEEQHTRFRRLRIEVEHQLRRQGVGDVLVKTRRFAPTELPAVVIASPESEAEARISEFLTSSASMELLAGIAEEALERVRRRPVSLLLNADNPIVRRIAALLGTKSDPPAEVMTGLYHSAVLDSVGLLNRQSSQLAQEQFVRLLDRASADAELVLRLHQERGNWIQERDREKQRRPEHVVLFMITPFEERYRGLQEAVRRVFERAPYFFEVKTALDETLDPALLANVRQHLNAAHGFIAEISDLNPNVMLELGAALLPEQGQRPVFTLRSGAADLPVPADLSERLRIEYSSPDAPVAQLEEEIRRVLERDGEPSHQGTRNLLEQRRVRFLSRTFLETLRVRFDAGEVELVRRHFKTVEQLLAIDRQTFARRTGLKGYFYEVIRGELDDG